MKLQSILNLFLYFLLVGFITSEEVKKTQGLESEFDINILGNGLHEAMEMAIANDGRVFIAERFGKVKLWSNDGKGELIEVLDLKSDYRGESGLMGITLDPNFDQNQWLYLYHSVAIENDKKYHEHHLSRFTLKDSKIDKSSEKILLKVKASFVKRIHEAGSLAFGPDGLLYLSVGDNQIRSEYLFSCKTSSNSNDFRGKILRIKPTDEGGYEIPKGNLFPVGTEKTKPEIYVMGCRNPFRISVDSKTGWLLWGENGPPNNWSGDLKLDKTLLPIGYEEFNLAKEAGYYGYPMIIADNKEFINYDYAKGKITNKFSAESPINNHPGNTGLQKLPPSKPALIWYEGESAEFPEFQKGGESAIAGPIYRTSKAFDKEKMIPQRFEGHWFVAEWARGWVKAVELDESGKIETIKPIIPKLKFGKPINLKVGPDGRLYVLYYSKDTSGHLIRLENKGVTSEAVAVTNLFETDPMPRKLKKSNAGYKLMKKSDCFACHQWNHSTIAPAYIKIAEKYKNSPEMDQTLVSKVKLGGVGVWGHIPMTPHPQHTDEEIKKMVSTILSIKRK